LTVPQHLVSLKESPTKQLAHASGKICISDFLLELAALLLNLQSAFFLQWIPGYREAAFSDPIKTAFPSAVLLRTFSKILKMLASLDCLRV
jgi:hypothetical protein